nr:MAG: stabilization protein [Bacteriophage sp.]
MKISQKLNFDSPYENLNEGDLVHAGNIMIDKDTETICNELGLIDYYLHGINAKIVGHIECNEEFIVFFDNNDIYRINVKKVIGNNNPVKVNINWHWCGGEVFGTYTYNVNNELILCISELNPTTDCPLKSINLDKDVDLKNYTVDNDELYTELATAPICNFGNVRLVNGNRIKKGTYVFFIRYWIDDYYNTIWFPIGYPIQLTDLEALTTPKTVFNYNAGEDKGSGKIQDYYSEDDDYTNTNMLITVRMFADTKQNYTKYQLAAIVNGNASTEAVVWNKKTIGTAVEFTIDNNFETMSIDELTNEPFNFYNVKTLDNYRNRVYLANYKLDNKNKPFLNETDYGQLLAKMNNVVITAVDREKGSYPEVTEAIDFFKPKPGRRGVYCFFVHYVYSNGTYTDGVPILTANNGTPTVDGTKLTCTIFGDSKHRFCRCVCPADKIALGGIVFEHIPMIEGFVGYFISYAEPEYVEIGSGFITRSDKYLYQVKGQDVGDSDCRFNYPEFSIVGGKTDAKKINEVCYFEYTDDGNLNTRLHSPTPADVGKNIISTNIVPPNSYDNIGREGTLKITLDSGFNAHKGTTLCDIYNDNYSELYLDADKNLISLGYIEYVKEYNPDTNYTYGKSRVTVNGTEVSVNYAWNYYWNVSTIFTFHPNGIIFSDVDWNPYDATTGDKFYGSGETVSNKPLIYSYTFVHESHYFLMGKKLNISPRTVYYNYTNDGNNKQGSNLIIDPSRVNDLYNLTSNYYSFYRRVIVNYNKTNELYKREQYSKTVYRTNVIGDESVVNAWKHISPESYKIINENKGDITNIVAAGTYLLVHTEKSLFAFDINNELKTNEQTVQMLMPDVFEVDYKEVFTTKFGICGFQDFISYINGDFGYIFYDSNAHKFYKFDAGSVDEINNNITKFIESYNADRIYIGYDSANARLLFNFMKKISNDDWKSCIISYSLYNNDWLSSHSYTSNYKFVSLKDNFYVIDYNNNYYRIKQFSNTVYNEYEDNALNEFINNEIINNKLCSYIDVYFNPTNINNIKILNFITYVLNKEKDDYFDVLGCYIYTNCCYSDYCNLIEERNNVAEYKKPVYEFGRWNYNWFYNKLKSYKEQEIFGRITGKYNTELEFNKTAVDAKLMVGKYAIVRFVFRNINKKVLIKDIQAYFNK